MKNIIKLLFISLMVVLTSCLGNSFTSSIPKTEEEITKSSLTPMIKEVKFTKPATPTKIMSSTPSITPKETETPMPTNTSTPTSTPTPTISAETRLQFQCLDPWPDTPGIDLPSMGVIVMENRKKIKEGGNKGRNKPEDYLLDMEKKTFVTINNESEAQIDYAVSPDRKHVAYINVGFDESGRITTEELTIATADGQRLVTLPYEDGWSAIAGWLNNHQLAINLAGLDLEDSYTPPNLLALDPFTGDQAVLSSELPGIYDESQFLRWDWWGLTMFDPTLTRVVYLEASGPGYIPLTLWNVKGHFPLVTLKYGFPISYPPVPRWSQDGSSFIVEGYIEETDEYELFQVSRDGEVEQMTSLSAYQDAYLTDYSWSPDGQFVAAWLTTPQLSEVKEAELIILDMTTKLVSHTCLRIKHGGEGYGSDPPAPIWSPDGKQLVFTEWYEKDHRRVILVDIVDRTVKEIAQDMEPKGWMVMP